MTGLPDSWCFVKIVDVLESQENGKPFQQGWSPQCEAFPARDDDWGVLKTTAVQEGRFLSYENKSLPKALEPRPHLEVRAGDILMTCAGPRNRCGVTCLLKETRSRLMMSGKMYRFRPDVKKVNPKYLESYLHSHAAKQLIDTMKTGINDSGLNLTHGRFAELIVPLPALREQCRIVAKIEELSSELDNGVEALTAARDQLKVYRQAVLKHAFEGKLTAGWRATRHACKPDQIGSALSRKEQADEDLAQLPTGWSYVRLDELTDPDRPITYGVIKLGSDVEDGVPTLRSSDVRSLRIDLESVKRISPGIADRYRRTYLKGGEVLVTVRGTLGGIAVVPSSISGWNISREVALIAPSAALDPHYVQYLLASPQLETWFKARLRGVAYTGINLGTLREAPIILCSIEEQREIARSVEAKLSIIDATGQEIEQQLAKIRILRQAILRTAFSGQLVAQDPSDEPASVLLERIKAEKESHNKKTGRKAAA